MKLIVSIANQSKWDQKCSTCCWRPDCELVMLMLKLVSDHKATIKQLIMAQVNDHGEKATKMYHHQASCAILFGHKQSHCKTTAGHSSKLCNANKSLAITLKWLDSLLPLPLLMALLQSIGFGLTWRRRFIIFFNSRKSFPCSFSSIPGTKVNFKHNSWSCCEKQLT